MVAARSANQASDVSIASALGSLLHVHRSIHSPYWRLQALTRLAPLFDHFGLSRQRLNREIREVSARVGTSARIVAPDRRTPSERFIALVDEIWKSGDASRLAEARDAFARLTKHHRPIGAAHLARLELRFCSLEAALARVRGIKEQGRRSGALLVVVRGAVALGQIDVARQIADLISAQMMRERACLAIAEVFVERVAPREVVRLLDLVTLRGLQAERFWLYQELRHRQRKKYPSRVLVVKSEQWPEAVESSWTTVGARRSSIAVRRDLLGVAHYIGLRHWMPDDAVHFNPCASRMAEASVKTDADRRELVRLLALDSDPLEAIHLLGECGAPRIVDGLLAEWVAQRVASLLTATLPASMSSGLRGEHLESRDPRSIERALYDEGVALSVRAAPRRHALATVIRYCVRSALLDPETWHADVIATRLRTLTHLDGERARDALAKPLATLPVSSSFAGPALETLAVLDANAAAGIALARACELGAAAVDRALSILERHHGIPRGFASAYSSARVRVGEVFLVDLFASWSKRASGPVPVLLLEVLAKRESAPASPQALFDELGCLIEELACGSHIDLAHRAARESGFVELLQIAASPRVDAHVVARHDVSWSGLLDEASSKEVGVIDFAVVAECAEKMRCDELALARGDLVALGAQRVMSFSVDGEEYRVILLDKRRDLLTYLRFADVAACTCYRTDTRDLYEDRTRLATLEVWKDPLSFCLRIERGVRPIGFTFGTFIEIEGRIGIALSGIYMRPNTAPLRAEVVRGIERGFCAPLGVRDIGIATRYRSRGPLPPEYVEESVTAVRLRALRRNGRLVTRAYDDVSWEVNEQVVIDDLHWRRGA